MSDYKDFAARFARTVIDEDMNAAHQFFAPWLQQKLSPDDFRAIIERWLREVNEYWEIEELIFPETFSISGNSSTLTDLKETVCWREPRKISDEVSDDNFRQWMVIHFMPDETDERVELDGWFDFWFILVETDGELSIGFFELEHVD